MFAKFRTIGRAAAIGGCLLLATSGCVRKGILLDCSLEINRVPWRTGSAHGEVGGCSCQDNCKEECGKSSGGGCDNGCASHQSGVKEASAVAPLAQMPGRFHPVPTRPVFGVPTLAGSSGPVLQPAHRGGQPEQLPAPEPDDVEGSEARRSPHRMRIELGKRAVRDESGALLAQHS
jgi:hypothetical protein